jgi:thiol-disulfide isomerase/thioredoxin
MRKIIFILLFLILGISFFNIVFAKEKLEIHFFYLKTCPHCAAEEKFLDKMQEKYPEVKINRYFIGKKENQKLLRRLAKEYGAEQYIGLVPLTFVGKEFFVGFDNQENVGKKIEESIKKQLQELKPPQPEKKGIYLPFIGEVDLEKYALPLQAVILGFFDGFNVCSLGALVLILGLVLALRQRRKILLFGGIFILTTAVIYGLLIVLWYQLFSFLASYLRIMEILIGLLGLVGGFYFLRQFIRFKKQGPACEAGAGKKITAKFLPRIKESIQKSKNIFLIATGVLFFAAIITIVEFPCSAVIPVIFAGILSQAHLSPFWYLLYIFIYLFFYLLDEIIVFLIAVVTMSIKLSSQKFITWITLAEAIILFILGLYYLL